MFLIVVHLKLISNDYAWILNSSLDLINKMFQFYLIFFVIDGQCPWGKFLREKRVFPCVRNALMATGLTRFTSVTSNTWKRPLLLNVSPHFFQKI